MNDTIWDYLNIWIRKKIKEVFTTDAGGDTAVRVVGDLELSSDDPNTQEVLVESLLNTASEYEIILPVNTKRFTIFCRDRKKVLLAYNNGETANNYETILPGETHDSGRIDYISATSVFLKPSSNNISVEIKVQRKL